MNPCIGITCIFRTDDMRSRVFSAFLLTTSLLAPSGFGAEHVANTCEWTRFRLADECDFYAKRGVAKVHADPDRTSKVITTLEWTYLVTVRKEDFAKMPLGWLRHSTDMTGFTHRYTGWIPIDSVVDSTALEQVRACWPIKRVTYSEGDAAIDVLSGTDGRYYNAYLDPKMTLPIGRVYYAQGIVLYETPLTPALKAEMKDVHAGKDDLSITSIAGFDPLTREFLPAGYKPEDLKVEFHSPEALKGCTGIVTKPNAKLNRNK